MIETKFKNTEIGLIPEDWQVFSLADVGEIQMCKRIMKHQTTPEGEIPFFKIGTFGKEADAYISRVLFDEFKSKYNYPQCGDILLSAAGTIGRTVVFDGKPAYFQDSNIVWINNDENLVLNKFLYYIYQTINWVTDTGTIPRIYNGVISNVKFYAPNSLPEQRRIAEVLSEADDLIKQWENVIAKKRDIKTATMQLLLTGKKRLNGFDKPWVEKKLGEVKIENGQMLNSSDYIKGNIPVIAGGKGPAGYHNIPNRYSNTITISGSGANAGYVAYHSQPIFASDCSTINDQDGIFVKYLFYVLVLLQNDIYKCQAGGAQPHIHAKDIKDISFYLPDLTEQRAIAEILSDMDEEIKTLEMKVEKLRNIKSGMMQQLLSGKIRLVGEDAGNVKQFVENNFGQMPYAAEDEAEFGL